MVKYVDVTSSNIAAVGHDGTDLFVKFLNGSEYKYYNVPEAIYEELKNAGSVGQYLNQNIKGSFGFEKVA